MLVRTAVTFVVGVQDPPLPTVPQVALAEVALRSVAQFTMTDVPTRSVR
jgi:hypothetical protein